MQKSGDNRGITAESIITAWVFGPVRVLTQPLELSVLWIRPPLS
jgi:hypothetical protein